MFYVRFREPRYCNLHSRHMLDSRINQLKSRYVNRRLVFVADVLLSIASSFLVLLIVNLVAQSQTYGGSFLWQYLATAALFSIAGIYFSGSYKIIIRHLGARDIVLFGIVALVKAAALLILVPVLSGVTRFVTPMVILDFLLTFFLLVAVRLFLIIVYDTILKSERKQNLAKRLLIYGISEKSVAAYIRLRNSTNFKIIGFISREKKIDGIRLEQLPVYSFSGEADFGKLVKKDSLNAVLFATENDARDEENGLLKFCAAVGVKTLIIPTVDEVKEGQSLFTPREIKVEDLLGREEIKINMDAIKANFAGKTVMVTGAAGSIGSELVRQLAGFGVKSLILYDNAETPMHNLRLELESRFPDLKFVPIIGDVRQERRLDFAFRTYRPQVVFHAAAYKHVPLMEENPCEAVLVNVVGSRQVADKCIQYDVEKMVMISTDKAVNPTNIMGCTKRLAEIYVQSLGLAIENGTKIGKTVFVTTRFGNVLGSNGSVIPLFRKQIADGGPVTVTHPDINRYFMTIPEACRLVMEAATMAQSTKIFVFDMGKPVKIDTLARTMITLAGYIPDRDIKIEYTGLRPGEKLYEEVLSTSENSLSTSHDRIRIAKVREYDYESTSETVDRLETLSREVEIPEMVRLMKDTVPEFKSASNSRFAKYDEEKKKDGQKD